jgi:urea transport system permease protein
MSLIGAVYGTLLVNFGKTYFSESFPTLWLIFMGVLFVAVVMGFPNGLAGVYTSHVKPKLFAREKKVAATAPIEELPAAMLPTTAANDALVHSNGGHPNASV